MSESYRFDVAVVGGGIAGLVAGVQLCELGLRVGILEKGEEERYPCNSRFTGGFFHVAFQDINAGDAVLLNAIRDSTQGFARPDLAEAVARETRLAVQWLKSKGVKFIKGGAEGWKQNMLAPPGLLKPGLHWEGRGGDVTLRTLASHLRQLGGKLLLGTHGRHLVIRDGRCVGLEADRRGERVAVEADSVVLCDGGFQANHALMREFVTAAPEKVRQRGAATGHGDALQMAREVGAQLVGMENVYGHLLCRDAMQSDELWPYPILDVISRSGILVDGSGQRFTDEGMGGVYMTNAIARLGDPFSATVVYDEAIWNGPGREFLLPANPNLVSAGGTILKAPSIANLSRQLGFPEGALEQTVEQYNAAVDAGRADRLHPRRTTAAYPAHVIRKEPYYAVRLCAGVTYTMGGIATDADARVIDTAGKPIAGLYAAGCTAGGLEGGAVAGYVGGLAKSAVTAIRAANHIAKHRST